VTPLGQAEMIRRIIVVDHAIRIIGSKETLARAITGDAPCANVRSFEPNWRARRDEDANLYNIDIKY
jgi:hypothetical protein